MLAIIPSFLLLGYLHIVLCLQIIPERAEVYAVNKSHISNWVLNVRRLGRRGVSVVNLNFTLLNEVGNNVTMDILFFEYLHNEYRRSFVEMHFRFCDLIQHDELLGPAIHNAGMTSCPLKPGNFSLSNMTIPNIENFPYIWPFERAKAMGTFWNPKTGAFIGNGSIFVLFKNKKI